MKILKPLIVVLGGIRPVPIKAVKKDRRPAKAKNRRQLDGLLAREKRVKETTLLLQPGEWKAANRFRKNATKLIRQLTYPTPFGRIALAEHAEDLIRIREWALQEAVLHNLENPKWQILIEGPTWAELGEDALSTLMTNLGGKLPDWAFDEVDGEATLN